MMHKLLERCSDMGDEEDNGIFWGLLTETMPHLDKPTLFLNEEGAKADSGMEAGVRAGARAAPRKPADRTTAKAPAGSMNDGATAKAASSAAPHTAVPLGSLDAAIVSTVSHTSSPWLKEPCLSKGCNQRLT